LKFQEEVSELKAKYDLVPHLAIVQVGDREDSSVYVRMKEVAATKVLSLFMFQENYLNLMIGKGWNEIHAAETAKHDQSVRGMFYRPSTYFKFTNNC
jgi:5,10-methylene-tetrahydrofolate dehydrogenase/methenyl tetrahydrofolate cyclohydrolase